MRNLLIFAPVLALTACAQATDTVNSDASTANVRYETARYFSTSTKNVRVGGFNQTVLGTKYKANVGGRLYDCQYFRKTVTCENA